MNVPLPAIDGANPLGFLAALGALSLATDSAGREVRVAWSHGATGWRPAIEGPGLGSETDVLGAIVSGHEQRDLVAELGWARDVMNISRDEMRGWISDKLSEGQIRAAEMVAACVGELPPPRRDERLAPYTRFRVVPRLGRARFLDTALTLSDAGKNLEDLLSVALFDGWRYVKGNNLRWDPGATIAARAYTAEAPTNYGPLAVPGAMLLAVAGLRFFPLMLDGRRAACHGFADGRDARLVWPIWTQPLCERGVRVLLGLPELYDDDPDPELLRRHGVVERLIARRERIGDDDEMLSWGESRVETKGVHDPGMSSRVR